MIRIRSSDFKPFRGRQGTFSAASADPRVSAQTFPRNMAHQGNPEKLDYIGPPSAWLDTSFPVGLQCRGIVDFRPFPGITRGKRGQMKYPVSRCAVACVFLLGASLAHAADFWYAGVGLGYGKVDFYP